MFQRKWVVRFMVYLMILAMLSSVILFTVDIILQ